MVFDLQCYKAGNVFIHSFVGLVRSGPVRSGRVGLGPRGLAIIFNDVRQVTVYLQRDSNDDDGEEQRVLAHPLENIPLVEDGTRVELIEHLGEHEHVEQDAASIEKIYI